MKRLPLIALAASSLAVGTAHAGIVDDFREASKISNWCKRARAETDDARGKLDTALKDIDAQIAALEQKVSDWKTKLAAEKSAIADRIYNGNQCLSYRTDVEALFADAKRNVRAETLPEIQEFIPILVAKYEAGEPNHAEEIRKVKDAIARCSGMR